MCLQNEIQKNQYCSYRQYYSKIQRSKKKNQQWIEQQKKHLEYHGKKIPSNIVAYLLRIDRGVVFCFERKRKA